MPNVKDFYPGATAGNPINNSTASVTATSATSATTATVGNSVDDQNQTPNALVWTGTAAEYAALGSKDANTLYFVI
jgi:hypothetical protein|tara:strand:- start:1095 stop:1322 length:228 start_codon:yes stop_codon:yes gene_type:complete